MAGPVRRMASTIRQIEHAAERDRRRVPRAAASSRSAEFAGGVVSVGLGSFDDNGPGEITGAVELTSGLWACEVRAVITHSSPGYCAVYIGSMAFSAWLGPLVDPATGGGPDRVIVPRHLPIVGTQSVDVKVVAATTPGPDHVTIGGSVTAHWLRPLAPEEVP